MFGFTSRTVPEKNGHYLVSLHGFQRKKKKMKTVTESNEQPVTYVPQLVTVFLCLIESEFDGNMFNNFFVGRGVGVVQEINLFDP